MHAHHTYNIESINYDIPWNVAFLSCPVFLYTFPPSPVPTLSIVFPVKIKVILNPTKQKLLRAAKQFSPRPVFQLKGDHLFASWKE